MAEKKQKYLENRELVINGVLRLASHNQCMKMEANLYLHIEERATKKK